MDNRPSQELHAETSITVWLIIMAVIATIAIGLSFSAYSSINQQRNDISAITTKLTEKDAELTSLRSETDKLKQEATIQKSILTDEIQRTEKTLNEIASLGKNLASTQETISAIKDDMKAWQKDYVALLLKIEEKIDKANSQMSGLFEGIRNLDAEINKVKSQASMPNTNTTAITEPAPQQAGQNPGTENIVTNKQ